MVWSLRLCISWTLLALILRPTTITHAQQISTNTPVPPLQWINLTNHLSGESPPPLKDASIGYDDTTRTIIIFGGVSAQGIRQQSTYLLNLNSLTWSQPSPPTGNTQAPPARSAAISGYDLAASYREGHIVIGGIGADGSALSDVWEFDFVNQFWQEVQVSPGGPSPRYGAVGGRDRRVLAASVPNLSWPNTSFYLAGGIDASTVSPLSDVWRLDVTGTLSSNNLNDIFASWDQVDISTTGIPSKVGAAGAVISQGAYQMLAAVDGCSSSVAFTPNSSCAQPDSYIINTGAGTVASASPCPAPRLDGTVLPNFNPVGTSSTPQVFLVLGLVNYTLWNDQGGLEKGEVDVLDIGTGEWARILPAGDPGSSNPGGTPAYPSARQGAVGLTFTEALVGNSRGNATDSIVFGGVDAEGNYLSEVWILRAYNAQLTQSNQSWTNYDGQLVGGPDATGQGVTDQYMTVCASALSPKATQTTAFEPSATSTGASPTVTSSPTPSPYDTSVTHKALSPISVALVMPAVIFSRLAWPAVSAQTTGVFSPFLLLSVVLGLGAYALGIAGLATSFTTIHTTVISVVKRSSTSSNILKTAHGRAGLALFVVFYGLLPLLFAFSFCIRRPSGAPSQHEVNGNGEARHRANSSVAAEKEGLFARVVARLAPRPSSTGVGVRRSSESTPDTALSPPSSNRSFEVTNRPARTRRASGNSLAAFSDPRSSGTPRNLSDLSWWERRRSLNTVGELDYALGQLGPRNGDPSTPATTVMDMTSTNGLMTGPGAQPRTAPEMPNTFDSCLHILFHLLLLGLCILILVALWYRITRLVWASEGISTHSDAGSLTW
ncbi:hypothetical protein IEO21_00823 [Rhodonia placenta]|uniref:Uncharacterized protein n=1 Tax=Rhodonia placenta TaxID=104341 RepID=A0A8H7PAS7_9APHY|nr:hypothetical protein IEO21_00823 [Postia placenta]